MIRQLGCLYIQNNSGPVFQATTQLINVTEAPFSPLNKSDMRSDG